MRKKHRGIERWSDIERDRSMKNIQRWGQYDTKCDEEMTIDINTQRGSEKDGEK